MSMSGDPRKQERPDGREPDSTSEVTATFPPTVTGVVTEIEGRVVPFHFVGGKAIRLTFNCGPMKVHMHIPPQAAQTVIDAIDDTRRQALTDLRPADWGEIEALTNGAKH